MDTYLIAKYLHLVAVVTAFGASTVMHFSLSRVTKAERRSPAEDALGTLRFLGPRMPIFIAALFITGGYMTQARWGWNMPWIQVSTAGLLSMLIVSGAILKPRMGAMATRLAQSGDDRLSVEMRASMRDPLLSGASNFQTSMSLTVMFLMVTKLGMPGSLIAVVVAVALAALSAVPMMKASERRTSPEGLQA